MTIADAIHEAARQLSSDWLGACDRLLAVHGATPATHVLVTRRVPGGQDAWVRLMPEPGYPMLQMRTEGTKITIRLVAEPT